MNIQIVYKLTEQELYKGIVETAGTRFVTKLLRIFGSVVLAVMLYIGTVNIINGIFYFSLGFVFPFFVGFYMIFLSEITSRFQVANLVKTKSPFTQELKVDINDKGYRMKGENFHHQLAWEKLHSIIETKQFFLLKELEATANMLPKRAFTEQQIIEFKIIASSLNGPVVKLR